MTLLKDVRHEFADVFVPHIKLHVGVSDRPYENIAVACVGTSQAAVLLSVEDGRAVALAILCACAQKDEELGRWENLNAGEAIDLLKKVVP